jgi:hypothetical protein
VAADNTYGNGELLQWLDDRGITPYFSLLIFTGSRSSPMCRRRTTISALQASLCLVPLVKARRNLIAAELAGPFPRP